MSENLIIRLGSRKQDKVHWLIWAAQQKEIIASGELNNADQLSELTEKATQRTVTIFVPGCDVAIKRLKVPGKSQKAIKMAAPYMLEDELAQDVESLFFAYHALKTDAEGHNCHIVAVDREQMQQWLSWLSTANIKTKILLPDVLAMPTAADGATAIMLDEQVLLRLSQWQGLVIDKAHWPIVAGTLVNNSDEEQQQLDEFVLNAYSPLPEAESTLAINAMPEELPLALLAENLPGQKFNLLQGEFQLKEKSSPVARSWYWAAGVAGVALLLNIGLKVGYLTQLNNQQEALEQQIVSSYKKAFPQSKKVRVATIRSQLKRKLQEVGDSSQSDGFLVMLTKVQPAFSKVPQLKPESVKFDGKRQELRMQASASDYQYFDRFKTELEKLNLTVNQGAQSNQGDAVSGSLSISNKGGRS